MTAIFLRQAQGRFGVSFWRVSLTYYGSAMRTSHVQGAFRQEIVVEAWQAHRLADHVSDEEGAMAEPLSVPLARATWPSRVHMGVRPGFGLPASAKKSGKP